MYKSINTPSAGLCTGCGACAAFCPVGAITVKYDNDGFLKASADEAVCTGCGICTRVCSKYKEPKSSGYMETLQVRGRIFAGCSKNEAARLSGSSGGVASEIARYCLKQGYKVCGAVYDAEAGMVKHGIAADAMGIEAFSGSKYIQSLTSDAFSQFKNGERYLVFGCPCQIYSIRQYLKLRNIEDNFILVDFFCHGVPSKLLWDKYIRELSINTGTVSKVNFRDKSTGWHNYSMAVTGKKGKYKRAMLKDNFYKLYLSDSCLNKPCYSCSFRNDEVYSDIRLGDFWGPNYSDDRKGVSLITVNNSKGLSVLNSIGETVIMKEAGTVDLKAAQPLRMLTLPDSRKAVLDMLREESSSLKDIIRKTCCSKTHLSVRQFISALVPHQIIMAAKKVLSLGKGQSKSKVLYH